MKYILLLAFLFTGLSCSDEYPKDLYRHTKGKVFMLNESILVVVCFDESKAKTVEVINIKNLK